MFMRTWSVCRFLRTNNFSPVQRLRCYSQKTKRTHYEVLGVAEDATPAEIQEAFLEKSKKFHPDLNKDDPNAKQKFIEVSDAYSVLSKESTRNDYDDQLEEEEMQSRTPFQEHEYYGRYSPNVDERVAAEREKWKRYYKSGQSQWQFEAENEQWQGRSQYENDGNIKSAITRKQVQLITVGLIALALAINFGGLYSTTQLRSKREAEKAAVINALKELEAQKKEKFGHT